MPSGYILIGDRIIKYNYENNNIYVGDAFYVSEGKIIEINKSSEILMDTILFDFKTKTFRDVTQPYYENTYLVNLFTDITKNKNAGIKKNKDKFFCCKRFPDCYVIWKQDNIFDFTWYTRN